MGAVVLDETMQKYIVSFFVGGGDTNGKGAFMVGLVNNPRPTFNNGEASVFSTIVLIVGMTWTCVFIPCGSMVVMARTTLAGAVNPWGSW